MNPNGLRVSDNNRLQIFLHNTTQYQIDVALLSSTNCVWKIENTEKLERSTRNKQRNIMIQIFDSKHYSYLKLDYLPGGQCLYRIGQ